MSYATALKKNGNICPFCKIKEESKIIDSEFSYIKLAMSPYGKDHIMVIPKRHVTSIFDLNDLEYFDIQILVKKGLTILKNKGYENLSVLVREGSSSGKSISHLHYHLVPEVLIGIREKGLKVEDRGFLNEKEEKQNIEEIKNFVL